MPRSFLRALESMETEPLANTDSTPKGIWLSRKTASRSIRYFRLTLIVILPVFIYSETSIKNSYMTNLPENIIFGKISSLLFCGVFLFCCSCSSDSGKEKRLSGISRQGVEVFTEGEKIPSLRLSSLEGVDYEINELAGDKLMILNFWASWCAPCVSELPALQELDTLLADKGVLVVTVNVDPPGGDIQVQDLVRKMNITIPVLRDPEFLSIEKFKVSGFPETFIINKGFFHGLLDPVSGKRTIRIRGDREWSSSAMRKAIQDESGI
jgi:thiol-disulfide isomerase/thioredoxin